jgi:nitrite reductase (NADH) small subunit
VRLCAVSDIAPGTSLLCDAGGRRIAVFNVDGTFHAIDDACAHKGGPLSEGMIDGSFVTCSWHFWRFELSTGKNTTNPDIAQRTHRLEIRGGDLYIGLS